MSSDFAPQLDIIYAALSTVSPSPIPTIEPGSVNSDGTRASWLWQFSTGPAMAGVLALGAAAFAFVRVGQQIAETRRGNNEIARKNIEDQWWETLKWTYTEAKESQLSAGAFQQLAAIKILESLSQGPDRLTVVQAQAVKSIAEIFSQSEKIDVQEAAQDVYQSLVRNSGLDRLSPEEYKKAVVGMLMELPLSSQFRLPLKWYDVSLGPGASQWGFSPARVVQSGRRGVLILTSIEPRLLMPSDFSIFEAAADASQIFSDLQNMDCLLISDAPQVSSVQRARKTHLGLTQTVASVEWSPGQPTDVVESVLRKLLDEGSHQDLVDRLG